MKGIPVQLQGIINFIDTTLQNRTLSQTFQCYLLNLEKATLDTLKIANIAFDNLDNHIPCDVRQMFQKTTAKIKEFIKNKPKGQLQKQQRYHHQQYDEVQNFLENRPEIQRSNAEERGQLFKFLNQVEEKQKQNKLLLQNIPKFSYGMSRNYSKQHRTYFSDVSDINMSIPKQNSLGRVRGSQIISVNFQKHGQNDKVKKRDNQFIEKVKVENQEVQTDLTLTLLSQIISHALDKKIPQQLEKALYQEIVAQIPKVSQRKSSTLPVKLQNQKDTNINSLFQNPTSVSQSNKKLKHSVSKKESFRQQSILQTQIQQENIQTEQKIKQELANIEGLELEKVEVKNHEVLVKGFIKNKKKDVKLKKNDNLRRDSLAIKKNKNADEILSSRPKKKVEPSQSSDKPEKNLQKLNKTRNRQNLIVNRSSKNFLRASQGDPSEEKKVQKYTQTQNSYEFQAKVVDQTVRKTDKPNEMKRDQTKITNQNRQITSNSLVNKQKSSSLQKLNVSGEFEKHRKSKQTQKGEDYSNNKQQLKDQNMTKSKMIQYSNHEDVGENANNNAQDHEIIEESESALPYLDKTNKANKYQIFRNNLPNFSLTNLKQNGEQKQLKKTKSNFSQFQSMHMNLSQYKLQRYNNQSVHKKELQRSLQNLPAIRQEDQNQIYKNREKVLSKGKAELLEKENKRILDQIQEGTSQKKGRNVEWIKVIRDIREYEHLHFKYCGENCVHLNKFYEFLKKKNLSMYINRKQLYIHKHNIEIKPALI